MACAVAYPAHRPTRLPIGAFLFVIAVIAALLPPFLTRIEDRPSHTGQARLFCTLRPGLNLWYPIHSGDNVAVKHGHDNCTHQDLH
jgi:hypothetical protein